MYFNKGDVCFSIGDIGTWQNGIILYSMHEKAFMNTYEQFLVEKVWKKLTDVRKGKSKERSFNDRERFALSHFTFANPN